MSLRLGVPSKGRLMEKTFAWFGAHGIMLSRSGSEREYAAEVHGIDGLELVLLSAGEIPRELQAGRIHLGVPEPILSAKSWSIGSSGWNRWLNWASGMPI